MQNPFKTIKRMYKLSQKDSKILDSLTDEQIELIPDEDTKAEFIGEGTREEFEKYDRERKGFKGIFGLDK